MKTARSSVSTSSPRGDALTAKYVSFNRAASGDAASESTPLSHQTRSVTLTPTLATTKKSAAKTDGAHQTAASRSSTHHLTATADDPRRWILALGSRGVTGDDPLTSSATAKESDREGASRSTQDGPDVTTTTDSRSVVGDPLRGNSGATATMTTPPLEERIGLHELKSIMFAFRYPSHASVSPSPSAAVSTRPTSSRKARGAATEQKLRYLVANEEPSVLGETLRHVDELSSTVAELLATEHDGTIADGRHDDELLLFRPSSGGPASTTPLHNLSREAFTQVLQRAVPSATPAEIHDLLTKAVSDNQDTVSWNELATFLVTASRQKADLAMEDQRFVLSGQPSNLHLEDQHSDSITCVAVSRQRHLVVTGCSGGSVRAWSSGSDLAYRGMLLKVDGWIMGLHWGCRDRVLYVVTMDRYVYVLEGTTYAVLRVFHGRGIKGTPDSVAYATETISTMRVGGVALPKHHPPNERGYAGARLHVTSAKGKGKSLSSADRSGGSGGGSHRGGKVESREGRMNRLLSSAMQVRRGVQPNNNGEAGPTSTATAAAVAAPVETSDVVADASVRVLSTDTGGASGATLTTSYALTTASAAEALHQDSTPLTGAGRGPYVVQHVEEDVLTSLVDAVTATAFAESAFQEDVLLLGTSNGDVFLFPLAVQCEPTHRRVLVARHVLAQLHHGPITKLVCSHHLNALVSSGEDGRVRVTSLVSGQNLRTFYAPDLPEQHASVTDFALQPQLKMLLTVGPERRALVWEWNQLSPIAVLESVNRPLCCCAFLGEQLLTVSRDHVLHVYDCKSFRLRQELALGSAGSLTRLCSSRSGTTASSCTATQLYADPVHQRVLGFSRFPFAVSVKRQVSSGCPVRYHGHHAPLLTTLTSRAFGQLVTVGADGVVMTWVPRTGANEFSFLLSNFSNASATTGAPMPPVAASMDVLQRRLLTGFAGGVVVAWNVLNGQVERVLTAAPSTAGLAPASLVAEKGGSAGGFQETSTHPHGRGAAATATVLKRDVTAVGSFLRSRSISYIFAIGRVLYVDATTGSGSVTEDVSAGPELGEYTTTYPSAWTPHPVYGEITQLLQLNPQHVACGTTSGAVLVYNVLSGCQEGAPLWVREFMLYPTATLGSVRGRSVSSRREGSSGVTAGVEDGRMRGSAVNSGGEREPSRPLLQSNDDAAASGSGAGNGDGTVRGYVAARTTRLLTLPAVHPRLLVMAQEDGTLSCWHTLRRVCVGAVSLTAVGLAEDDDGDIDGNQRSRGDSPPGTFAFDMDEDGGELLVFGDGEGNVHVCRAGWQVLASPSEQAAALALPNPAVYTLAATATQSASGRTPEMTEAASPIPHTPTSGAPLEFNEVQRSVPVLRQLERVHVFATGLALTGLRVVDAAAATAFSTAAAEKGKDTPPSSSVDAAPSRHLLVVCTGADHFVRVFTLAGLPIGELGMDEWDVADPRTFRFMGEPMGVPAAPLPCSVQGNLTWQRDSREAVEASPCYFNYLADLHTAHFTRVGLWNATSHASGRDGRVSVGGLAQTHRPMAAERLPHSPPLDAATPSAMERVLSPSVTLRSASPTEKRTPSLSPERRSTTLLHAALLRAVAANAHGRSAGLTDAEKERGEDGEEACRPPPTPVAAHRLSTRLRRSTRYRYSASSAHRQHSVVKPSCVDALRPAAAVMATVTPTRGQQSVRVMAGGSSTTAPPSTPFTECGLGRVEKEWSASSLPCDESLPLAGATTEVELESTGLLRASLMAGSGRTHHRHSDGSGGGDVLQFVAAERGGSASTCRCNSASTRVPKSPAGTPQEPSSSTDAFAASVGGGERDAAKPPLPFAVTRITKNDAMRSAAMTTPTSSERRRQHQQRAHFPNLPQQTPSSLNRSPSPIPAAAAAAAVREKRDTVVSPESQRNISLHAPSRTAVGGDSATDGEDNRHHSGNNNNGRNGSDACIFAALLRERQRLVDSTRTSAARDQLSSLAMPILLSPAQAATTSPSSPSSSAIAGNVQQHIDSLLERRRTQHVCGVTPEAEMRKSARGYVAHMTSKMYVAPMQEPSSPGLTAKRPELSTPPLPPQPRPRSHLGQTL